jgi:hypothetical protein
MKTEVRKTRKYGRGVFATRDFKRDQIVEISPVIIIENPDFVPRTILNTYTFEWNRGASAIALGVGSLFNHSKRSNVTYNPVFQNKTLIFVARRDIRKGEQLFIDYGYDPKYGVETTEKAMYNALKRKYEPKVEEPREERKSVVAPVSSAQVGFTDESVVRYRG